MIVNYFRLALRNLLKRKVFTAINMAGLATGVAVCLLIGKYISFETSYDDFHVNGPCIYRVVSTFFTGAVKDEYEGYDMGPALAGSFPEVAAFARVHSNGSLVSFTTGGKEFKYRERGMLYVDSTFLYMFSFGLLRGNRVGALRHAQAVIVTESIARKYFGTEEAVGKVIRLHDGWTPGLFEITAVMKDVPANSHLTFDLLLPMEALMQTEFYKGQHARWDNFHTYFQLRADADIDALTGRIPRFVQHYRGNDKNIEANASLEFQPLHDIHYSPDLNNGGSHLATIFLFATIALFVLAIAWINYINLSTARAVERAREVGVKKAIGASRRQLVIQFFVESGVVNLVSVLLAAGMAMLLLPVLNGITGRSFEWRFSEPAWWVVLGALFVAGTLISGIYPALVLSSFKTTEVIKGKIREQRSGWSLRHGLVGFQFACSLMLLVATLVIFRQVKFMQQQDKEFTTEQTIIVKGPELSEVSNASERITSFRNELLQYPFVKKVATSFSAPGDDASVSAGMRKLGEPVDKNRIGNLYYIDPYFIDLYGIDILSGKTWDPQMKTHEGMVVINEEAVKVFGLGGNESALRAKLILPFDTVQIIGVVKNHHWNSMKKPYTAMIFKAEAVSGNAISIQLGGDVHQALAGVAAKYKADFPDDVFSYYFLDDFYGKQYREEEVFGELFTAFSVLALLIGCLGLWGLAAYATMRRQKEIGIRKTLGASVRSIVVLLVHQFVRPLFIAGIIVLPLAWMGVQRWLEKFPYRIGFSIDLLLLPLGVLLLVALATVSYQTLGAARANPVDSLKGE